MIKVTKKVNIDLFFEELEVIPGAYWIDGEGKRHAAFGILKTDEGYEIYGLDESVVLPIINAHDDTKLSQAELDREKKKTDKANILNKLKITEEELKLLIENL